MKKKVRALPQGYNTVTPYLCVNRAVEAIAFYKKAFGAKEIMRMPGPGGTIGHAEEGVQGVGVPARLGDPDTKHLDQWQPKEILIEGTSLFGIAAPVRAVVQPLDRHGAMSGCRCGGHTVSSWSRGSPAAKASTPA